MSRGRHPKSAVASVLSRAKDAGLIVEEDHNRHRWGWVICPTCRNQFTISGTPRNPDDHAKDINSFVNAHLHEDVRAGGDR